LDESPGIPMSQRQQYIIDRKFQLKHTFVVIGAVTAVTVIILSIIATNVFFNNSRINNIYIIEGKIMEFYSSEAENSTDSVIKMAAKTNKMNHDRNMETLKDIITNNEILLGTLVAIVFLQGIALYILLIRRTHRISGPIYVMSQYIKQILNGERPKIRNLRKKDEIQDFYSLLKQLFVKYDMADDITTTDKK
jgi:hypothetical protein